MTENQRIVLVGFSGSGKSTVARILADKLGWRRYDMDDELERSIGMSIPDFFRERGEDEFRIREREHLTRALALDHVVVATGGGAVIAPETWGDDFLGNPGTLAITLDAQAGTMLDRLRRQQAIDGEATVRPMLAGDQPLARISDLKTRRQEAYDRAAVTLVVDNADANQIADEIVSLLPNSAGFENPTLRLQAVTGSSDIYISPGISRRLGNLARDRWPKARRAWIVTDDSVGKLHGEAIAISLADSGFDARQRAVPHGESSKSWQVAGELHDWLLTGGIERGDVVVALGGGVVGDLAGFIAATVLRGVGLVQIPTTLLAMVDSSVGGKTGINHATGKNLIGAFYQPPLVLIDSRYLQTLPKRELVSGWAEIIKHAEIQVSTPGGDRGDLIRFMERNVDRLTDLSEPALTYLIRRNVALKAAVVEADEKESGLRAYLNFGHTLGHAIEAAGYRYLHGEAIAVGMRAAMKISLSMGLIGLSDAQQLDRLIECFGLPSYVEVEPEIVMKKILSDKKRSAGVQRWVLPVTGGGVTIRDDIEANVVRMALAHVRR